MKKINITQRMISLLMAVLMALPFSMFGVFADGLGDGRGNVYAGMIDVPSYAHQAVNNLMDGSRITTSNGAGALKYYRKSDNSLVPLYCVEPGIDLHTGDNLDLNNYIRNKTNNTLTEKEDVSAMLGRLFLFAYTGEASDLAEPMAQYFASQLLVWEIVAGERDLFFNHINNSNGGNVCDVLSSMNSSVANRVKGYYNSYVSQMKDHMKMPSFTSLRESSAQVFSVDSSGKAVLTDTNNVLSNFTFSSDAGTVSVSGNKLTITVDAGKTATITASKKVNTQKRVMFCYGASGLQTVVSVGSLESDPRNAFIKVKGLEKGVLEIIKTSDDGVVSNISFTVTGGGKTYHVKTDVDGKINIPDLTVGTYTVTETVPVRYQTQQSKTVTVQAGKTASVSFANVLKKGSIKINKQAEDGEVGGRTFTISGNGKTYTITTNSDGVAILSDIPVYDSNNSKIIYTISEKNVPVKYVVPANQSTTLTADVTTAKTFKNVLKKFTLTVQKQDGETKTAQGNGTLSGAVYGIYNEGKLVDRYTTDKNGNFTSKEYICGDHWTLKEISPSEGYLLDETTHKIGAEPKHYTLEKNAVSMTVNEEIIKGNIAIIKHSDDGSTQIETPENGAEFKVYLKSAGSFEKAKESEKDVLICDENGYAKSKNLPYGVYVVHQTKGLENTQSIHDFEVNINENEKTYQYIINNAVKKSLVKIIKKDAETGKVIAVSGIGFKVWDKVNKSYVSQTINYPSQVEIDTFYTDNSGTLMLPQELAYGEYELHEVQTTQGYWLGDEVVSFTIDGEEKVVEVEKYNEAQKGKISVQKSGDVFTNVAVSSSVYLDENGKEIINPTTYTPVFEEKGLENAVFEVLASEDIITSDGTIRAKKGDVVAEITTDKNGYAQTELLHLGKYEICEKTAPYGYVKNGKPQLVELTYAGQEFEEKDTVNTGFFNDYQGIEISLEKLMEQDKIFGIRADNEHLNVRFGLFADEEIMAQNGTIIPKDGLIAEVFLDENMTAKFTEKIPFGRYYVQEISTDEHYTLNGEKYLVSFEYLGQETHTVSVDLGLINNNIKRGSVKGLKLNESDEPLENAVFGLFATGSDTAILTAKSDENGYFSFENVPFGEYEIREIEAPTGYVLSDESYFVTISEEGEIIEITAVNKRIRGNVSVIKFDEEYLENRLSGAEFTVYSDKACTAEIGKLMEIQNGIYVLENLEFGQYFLKETHAPTGFVLDENVYPFNIQNDGESIEIANTKAGKGFVNSPIKGSIEITKTDISDGRLIPNCGIEILDSDGNVVFQGRTDENGVVRFKNLRYGDYFYREFDAPNGYLIDENAYPFSIKENGEIVKSVLTNEKKPDVPDVPKIPDNPKTGVDNPLPKLFTVASIALILSIALWISTRRKEDSNENEA